MPPTKQPKTTSKAKFFIVRASSAGVFAGEIESRDGNEVVMTSVRRLWYWRGAASLSQMAQEGVSRPSECKFSVPVDRQTVLGVIEILEVTRTAEASIKGVTPWRA